MTTHPAPQLALIALSACPLCGGEAFMETVDAHQHTIAKFMPDYPGGAIAQCLKCSLAIMREGPDAVADVTAAWNTRPQSRPEAELPELPEPDGFIKRPSAENSHNRSEPYYFASKLRAYGQQCAATRPANAESLANARGDGWLPIESAPKDGSLILLVAGPVGVRTGKWSFIKKSWHINYSPNYSATRGRYQPTHWRPLPAPPDTALQPGLEFALTTTPESN